MGRVLFICAAILGVSLPFLAAGGAVSAEEFNHTITVYAIVPEQRGIYVDKSGHIVKIAGNTTENVTPQVYTLDNNLIPMNDSVQKQYDQFLKDHHNRLEAGKTYLINNQQLTISQSADNRQIKIDTSALTLGAGQSG